MDPPPTPPASRTRVHTHTHTHTLPAPRRSSTSSGDAASRLTTAFLTELDGILVGATGGAAVVVVAISALPDQIDPAVRRPGRLDQWIALDLPDTPTREGATENTRAHEEHEGREKKGTGLMAGRAEFEEHKGREKKGTGLTDREF